MGSEQLRGRTCCWLGWDGSGDLLGPAEFLLAEMLEAVGCSSLEPMEEVWARDMNLMESVDLSAFFYSFDFLLLHSHWGEGKDISDILD